MTNYLSLDLELNQNKNGAKIIQIGAVVGNITTGEILETFSRYIKIDETLEPFIIKLTKITQEQVDGGINLLEGFNDLVALHKKYNCFINLIQWGHGDCKTLKDELQLQNPDIQWPFGRRDIDCKTLYVGWKIAQGQKPVGGLSRAAANLKVRFDGHAHNATWDSLNTFNVFYNLINRFKEKTNGKI